MAYKPSLLRAAEGLKDPQILGLIVRYLPHCLIMTAVIFGGYISGLYLFMMPAICAYLLWLEYINHKNFKSQYDISKNLSKTQIDMRLAYADMTRIAMIYIAPITIIQVILTLDWSDQINWITSIKSVAAENNHWFIDIFSVRWYFDGLGKYDNLNQNTEDMVSLTLVYAAIISTLYYFLSLSFFIVNFLGTREIYTSTNSISLPLSTFIGKLKLFIFQMFLFFLWAFSIYWFPQNFSYLQFIATSAGLQFVFFASNFLNSYYFLKNGE
jgi:hypothetical protein